ncbi:hypothetical protein [Sphingobium lactosutens]|nr:hypothetical protein [Sphingobium lactosutens]
MIQQYLTRFDRTRVGYSLVDTYHADWNPTSHHDNGGQTYDIAGYLFGAVTLMKDRPTEPKAWGFGSYVGKKGSENTSDNWRETRTIKLEYHTKDRPQKRRELHEAAERLGYAHCVFDSSDRYGAPTVAIILPLTEAINEGRYARLATVFAFELDHWRAVDGYSSMTHLAHVDQDCVIETFEGAVISPSAKIKETKNLYQNINPKHFCAAGPKAAVHLVEPIFTSHDGLFEWTATATETAQMTADSLLASIGVRLD